jgi:acetyltransferase-like isoleucine patch superfamily enzyme
MSMVHESVMFFGRERCQVAATARIDPFAVISAGLWGIKIGEYVHISAGAKIFGGGGLVELEDFSALSIDAVLLTATTDFMGSMMTSACVPEQFQERRGGNIHLRRHSVVGAKSMVFPGVTVGWGAAVGCMSLVKRDVEECTVVFGIPARVVGLRDRGQLEAIERRFVLSQRAGHAD